MHDFFIDGNADVAGEFLVAEKGALDARFAHESGGSLVDFSGGNARGGQIRQAIEDFGRRFRRRDASCRFRDRA